MRTTALILLIGTSLAGSPATAQEAFALSPSQSVVLEESQPEQQAIVIRNPYFNAYVHDVDAAGSAEEEDLTALDRLRMAGPWLKLLSGGDDGPDGWERDECKPGETQRPDHLCGLRWRNTRGLIGLTTRVEEISTSMKSRVVGKALAERLEVDLDTSPEIKFEWEFD